MQSVPRRTSCAITTQNVNGENRFNIYYPPTTGNYSSYYIQKPQRMINLLIPEKDMNRQLYNQDLAFNAEIENDVKEKESKQRERMQMQHEKRGHEVIFVIFQKLIPDRWWLQISITVPDFGYSIVAKFEESLIFISNRISCFLALPILKFTYPTYTYYMSKL